MAHAKGKPGRQAAGIRSKRDGHDRRDGRAHTAETDALYRAVGSCHAAFAYCASEANEIRDLSDLLCLADCAQICTITAEFIMRGSIYSDTIRDACLQMCMDAAKTCEAYPNDEVLSACADVLRDACDAMSVQVDAE
jgi:hypothetical protein